MPSFTPSDVLLNRDADYLASQVAEVSVHTGDPGSDGTANEASGGSYARQVPTWEDAGVEGPLGASVQPATPGRAYSAVTFPVPAGTYTHLGTWDSLGEFMGSTVLPGSGFTLASDGSKQVGLPIGRGV